MFKTRRLIVETVVFLLLATLLIAFYGGEDEVRADFLPEPGKVDEKIDRGLDLALEAIRIAGNHKGVEGVETNKTSEMYNPLIIEPIKIQKKKHNKKIQNLTSKHYTIKIPANKPWTRTGVSLKQDDIVRINCKGKVMPGSFEYRYKNTSCLAEGYHFTRDNFTVLPNARYMAAIGKIGNKDAFYIGSGREFVSYVDGPLYLGINELDKSIYTGEPINKRSIYWKDNTGYFEADIYIYRK
jgi:hypothetical protein